MNVRCHACKTVYRIDPAKVPSGGVRARCSTCPEIIDVPAPGATARTAPADARAPAGPVPPRPAQPVFRPAAAPAAEPRPAPPPAAAPAPPAPKPPKIKVSRPISGAAITTPPPAQAEPRRPARPLTLEKPTLDAASAPAAAPERPMAPVFKPSGGRRLAAPPVPPTLDEVVPPAEPAQPVTAPPAESPLEFPTAKPVAPAPRATPASPAKRAPINPFLTRDPRQKARRLARALVSDMIVYQPEKRQQALAAGNLKEAFDEEIKKSWEEYVEQVGEELANSTPYFTEALNDILAGGQELF